MRKRSSWLFLCFSFHLWNSAFLLTCLYHRLPTEASRFTWGMCYEFCLRLFLNFRTRLVPRSSAMQTRYAHTHTTAATLRNGEKKSIIPQSSDLASCAKHWKHIFRLNISEQLRLLLFAVVSAVTTPVGNEFEFSMASVGQCIDHDCWRCQTSGCRKGQNDTETPSEAYAIAGRFIFRSARNFASRYTIRMAEE